MWDKTGEYAFFEDREDYSHTTIEEQNRQYDELQGSYQRINEMKFKDTGGIDFEPAPAGLFPARCIRIIDLGTAVDELYQKEKHDVFFQWELPSEMKSYKDKEGKEVTEPFTVSKFYTMSLAESAHLRTDLESWRSKPFTEDELQGFDPKNILGAACMLNIIHKPKKRGSGVNAIVTAVTPLPKGIEVPPVTHDKVIFSLDAEDYDPQVFEKLPDGLKKRIQQSKEWAALQGGHAESADSIQQQAAAGQVTQDEFDDIPF